MKTIFHKFANHIYPLNLVVVITNNQTAVTDRFLDDKGKEMDDFPTNCEAFAQSVVEKETLERCDLIVFRKKEYATVSTICHESFHAALSMMDKMGVRVFEGDPNEHVAYLLGWIADCCNQVVTNKFK